MTRRNNILRCLLLGTLLLGGTQAKAQQFDGIKSVGPVPADLKKSLSELYSEDKARVKEADGRLKNRDQVLAASYQVNKMMAGGRITYGDPITRMVEKIADTLLRNYPDLRKELRFYTVKSPSVNAFATGQGMVFVNTGLLAQVEDEAQLAFVLSHEIVHYFKKHNVELVNRKTHRSDDEEAALKDFLKYHNRSHEMESEADSLGLALFYLDSPYDKQVTNGLFDVLQYGYLPFDELPFDTNYFNTQYYRLPSEYFLEEVADITARDDYDDSKSTHPNIKKRRNRTSQQLSGLQGGEKFVVCTPQEFAELQRLARMECVRQNLIYADYARAFYDSHVLQQAEPDNAFFAASKAQALYALSRYKTFTNSNALLGDYRDYEGEVQQVYYMFRKMPADMLCMMALREVWKAHQQIPADSRLMGMAEDLASDLFKQHGLSPSSFASQLDTTTATEIPDSTTSNKKYQRIKQKKQRQERLEARRYVFTDLMSADNTFEQMLERVNDRRDKSETDNFNPDKNVMLYCPSYYVYSEKDDEVKYTKSDRLESQLPDLVASVAKRKGLGTADFSDQRLRACNTADEYNDFVALDEWCAEFWQTKGSYNISLFNQPQMDRLKTQYESNLINLSIVANSEYTKSDVSSIDVFFSIVFLPMMPITLYQMAANKEETSIMSITIDATNGRTLDKHLYTYKKRDSKALVKQAIYDNFNRALPSKRAKARKEAGK